MGDVIDFAEKQKGRRKKKAFSIPPILRKFRVHAIRLLASIIKSGSYSVAYIVKKIRGLTLSGTKTHVKQLWLRKTKGSGEDPLVC